jgi:hypothetical protein
MMMENLTAWRKNCDLKVDTDILKNVPNVSKVQRRVPMPGTKPVSIVTSSKYSMILQTAMHQSLDVRLKKINAW